MNAHTCTSAHRRACTQTCIHTCTAINTQPCTWSYTWHTRACTWAHMDTDTHIYTHRHRHTHGHAHRHACMHSDAYAGENCPGPLRSDPPLGPSCSSSPDTLSATLAAPTRPRRCTAAPRQVLRSQPLRKPGSSPAVNTVCQAVVSNVPHFARCFLKIKLNHTDTF